MMSISEDNLLRSYDDDEYTAIDWTPDKGYGKNLPVKFSPRTSGGIGKNMGLTVILNASSDEYYCSKTNSAGFKVKRKQNKKGLNILLIRLHNKPP